MQWVFQKQSWDRNTPAAGRRKYLSGPGDTMWWNDQQHFGPKVAAVNSIVRRQAPA